MVTLLLSLLPVWYVVLTLALGGMRRAWHGTPRSSRVTYGGDGLQSWQ